VFEKNSVVFLLLFPRVRTHIEMCVGVLGELMGSAVEFFSNITLQLTYVC